MPDIKLNLAETPVGGKLEIITRTGEAAPELEIKAPIKTDISGTIGAPYEYLLKRSGEEIGQINQHKCHILVDRDEISITLIINEDDQYKRGKIIGKLELNPLYEKFKINTNEGWTPLQLGLFIKMNRAFFPDLNVHRTLVTQLMNYQADINQKVEKYYSESGNRTDSFTQVVNSNLPPTFNISIPIFKADKPENIVIETLANVADKAVIFFLLSPGANERLEDNRNKAIDEQLNKIKTLTPNIAIIEV